MVINAKTAAERLLGADHILILCHRDPDGDTQGSATALFMALQSLGKRVKLHCSTPFIKKLDFLALPAYDDSFEEKFTVAVDVAAVSMLGDGAERLRHINLCIDHHDSNGLYADETFLSHCSAAGEAMFEVITEMGAEISPFIATALLTAISSDTGGLRYSNTTANTLRCVAKLYDFGADTVTVRTRLFESDSPQKVAVEAAALSNARYYGDGKVAVISVSVKLLEQTGASEEELEGLPSKPIAIEGVNVGVTLKERADGYVRISVRTDESANANDICSAFKGGGHNRAAGCRIKCSLPEAEERIVSEALKHVK